MSEDLQYQSREVPESLFRSPSDSAQTPPSPVSYSKSRPSRSSSNHHSKSLRTSRRSDSHRSGSTVPTPQFKRERERQLANVPRDTLLNHTISKEYELREAKHMLTTALIQLEAIRGKVTYERDVRLALEGEKKDQAVKTTKALIDTQQDAMDSKEEVRRFQLQLENAQTELHKVNGAVHQLESDKTDLERELVRARDTARNFKEQNSLLHAREEGRREGFEEGLRQGRAMHGIIDVTQLSHLGSVDGSNAKTSSREKAARRRTIDNSHALDTEIDLRKIAEKDNHRLNLQVTQLSRELDQQRQKTKDVEAGQKRLVDENGRLKRDLRAKDDENARLVARTATLSREIQGSERKGRELNRKEMQVDELRSQMERLSADCERIQRDKDDAVRKLNEELEREKEFSQKEKERFEREKEALAASSRSSTYIPMPPPPIPLNTSGPIPRASSTGSVSGQPPRRRRLSVGSQSSVVSASFEFPQPQSPPRLNVIPESDDDSPPPIAFPQPSVPHIIPLIPPSPRVIPQSMLMNPQFLQPAGSRLYGLPNGRVANGSQSSIQINIEPPSRPPSVEHHEFDPSGTFLSPNHRPVSLPPSQEPPLPILPRSGRSPTPTFEYDMPGIATQQNSPVIPGVTVPMPRPPSRSISMNAPTPVMDGPLPPGFVPQTITNSKGVSTPIWQAGGLPPVGGSNVGGPLQRPPSAQGLGPYGNPLSKDREEENEANAPFIPFRPGSRAEVSHIPSGRPSSGGPGMTPAISPGMLPGTNVGPRSGMSIYGPGPPPVIPHTGNAWGLSPGPGIPSPLPNSTPNHEDDDHEDVDSETAHNTRINAGIGRPASGGATGYPTWPRR